MSGMKIIEGAECYDFYQGSRKKEVEMKRKRREDLGTSKLGKIVKKKIKSPGKRNLYKERGLKLSRGR